MVLLWLQDDECLYPPWEGIVEISFVLAYVFCNRASLILNGSPELVNFNLGCVLFDHRFLGSS